MIALLLITYIISAVFMLRTQLLIMRKPYTLKDVLGIPREETIKPEIIEKYSLDLEITVLSLMKFFPFVNTFMVIIFMIDWTAGRISKYAEKVGDFIGKYLDKIIFK